MLNIAGNNQICYNFNIKVLKIVGMMFELNNKNTDEKVVRFGSPTPNLQTTFFNDTIYIYSLLSVIVYSILFYIVSTPNVFQKVYFFLSGKIDLLRNMTVGGVTETIIVLFAWTLFFITTNKNKQNLSEKKIKFCLSYIFFILPITFFAFHIKSNISFTDICKLSLIFSVYRFIAVFIFLTVVNVFFESIYNFYKKWFQIK